jgi:hypothetical protein
MTKHTPGPWTIVDPEAGGPAVQSARMTSEARNGGFVSAICPGPDGEANARLITAAPDMLEALKIAEGIISNVVDSGKVMLVPHRNMIRDVIKQATGQ